MPVIPQGIAPFTIKPPLTTGDRGDPSTSILRDAQRVFDFIEDERHLTAWELYSSVKTRVETWDHAYKRKSFRNVKSSSSAGRGGSRGILGRTGGKKMATAATSPEDQEYSDAKAFLQSRHPQIIKLENRCRIFKRALQNLNIASDWSLASSLFGVKTFYRREEDGSLSLKLEGELKDCPLFEQVCVLKEVDLHYKWSPFCSSSMTIADLDKLDVVGWFVIGLSNFGLSRDGVFRAIGCDNIMEDGSIILAGQGIRDLPPGAPAPPDTYLCEDPILEKLDIPPVPTRRGGGRMTIRTFEAVIHVTSPTSARTRLVANIDPNLTFLPQPLLEFVMKNLAGVVLAKLQAAAKKIPRNPVVNAHARRMRDEEDFYRHWLMKKFQAICEINGWEFPSVSAFELTDEQLQKDNQLAEKRAKKDSHRRAVSFEEPIKDSFDMKNAAMRSAQSMPEHSDSPVLETESISEISFKSNRSISFKIGQVLKEREGRKRQKKEEEISQVRRMAMDRLRPKEFSADKQKRLETLRSVKAQRSMEDMKEVAASGSQRNFSLESEPSHSSLSLSPTLRHKDSAPFSQIATRRQNRPSVSEKVTDRLYRHGRVTRLLVIFLLTFVLFVLLHPKLLLALLAPDRFSSWIDDSTLLTASMRSLGALVYLFACTLAHFVLCDIALVYAFDSMELGSKAGKQMRKFYSVQVRFGVALFSFGLMAAATSKALFQVALRYIFWVTMKLYFRISDEWDQAIRYLGSFVPGALYHVWASLLAICWALWTACETLLDLVVKLCHLLIQSNALIGAFAGFISRPLSIFPHLWTSLQAFSAESIAIVNGEVRATPWYEDSFLLSKLLFSYTSVFLVTALIFFNLSVNKAAARSIKGALVDRDDLSTQASDLDSKSAAQTLFKPGLTNIPEHPTSTASISTHEKIET